MIKAVSICLMRTMSQAWAKSFQKIISFSAHIPLKAGISHSVRTWENWGMSRWKKSLKVSHLVSKLVFESQESAHRALVIKCACMLSCVQLLETPWTIAHPAPLSMDFSRQEHWSGFPFSPPGNLPDQGIITASPALAGGFFTTEPPGNLTAAAKSLQSCTTLCNPIDGSPPDSPVPGILQARTLEWVAMSFSNAGKWKVKVKSLSRIRLLATPWTAAYQAPLSMGFSRQEYWSAVPLPSPGNLTAAAAAKSLQSCPTLCDPIDGSPPGPAIPGILQARTLEWVAISSSNAWKWKVKRHPK